MKELTQEELKRLLHYYPETGLFTWQVKPSKKIRLGSIAGSLGQDGSIRIEINKEIHRAERLAVLYMTGEFPQEGLEVYHRNHIRYDNKWNNLRHQNHGKQINQLKEEI